jgi:hypothetical protein
VVGVPTCDENYLHVLAAGWFNVGQQAPEAHGGGFVGGVKLEADDEAVHFFSGSNMLQNLGDCL